MKKSICSLLLALTAVLALNAEQFTGDIVVTIGGQESTATVTVTVTPGTNGLSTFVLQVPGFGNLTMTGVPSSTRDGITVYSAERDVVSLYGSMRAILFARTVAGMMAADVNIPAYGVTMGSILWATTSSCPTATLRHGPQPPVSPTVGTASRAQAEITLVLRPISFLLPEAKTCVAEPRVTAL